MTIYRSALINRRSGLTDVQFKEHWIKVHGELASVLPGLGTYRQNHIAERYFEDQGVPVQTIDGISQLSFDNVESMEISERSQEYAMCKEDIAKFQGCITILVLKAHEMQSTSKDWKPGAKLLWLSSRRTDVKSGDFSEKWLDSYNTPNLPGLRRHVQNFVVDRSHPVKAGVPSGDAECIETVSEAWFDSVEALNAAMLSKEGKEWLHNDAMLKPFAIYRIEEIQIV